jgi:hypothetical protein
MEIEFRRTGERRYAIIIHRPDRSMLEMSPAPGYDPLMPHDLLHYVVERELGLRSGIFGQIAKGGGAGTFHVIPTTAAGSREAARQRRHLAKRDARLLREGRRDAAMSERAVYTCQQAWETRRAALERRKADAYGATKAGQTRAQRATMTNDGISDECLTRICARLDELSCQWAKLGVGESVTVDWPDSA